MRFLPLLLVVGCNSPAADTDTPDTDYREEHLAQARVANDPANQLFLGNTLAQILYVPATEAAVEFDDGNEDSSSLLGRIETRIEDTLTGEECVVDVTSSALHDYTITLAECFFGDGQFARVNGALDIHFKEVHLLQSCELDVTLQDGFEITYFSDEFYHRQYTYTIKGAFEVSADYKLVGRTIELDWDNKGYVEMDREVDGYDDGDHYVQFFDA